MRAWEATLAMHKNDGADPVWVSSTDLRPGTLVGDTVSHIRSHEGPNGFEVLGTIAGVETWAQRRQLTSAMHLHWDAFGAPEDHIDKGEAMPLPLLSCVLYTGNVGGPTLVLDKRPTDGWGETVRCLLCWPRAGRIFTFPGDLLHGVLSEVSEGEGLLAPPSEASEAAAHTGAATSAALRQPGDGNSGGEEATAAASNVNAQAGSSAGLLRVTLVLNLWEKPPSGLLELAVTEEVLSSDNADASDAADGGGSDFGAGAKRQRRAERPSAAARACDAQSADAAMRDGWRWRALTMGMFDETTRLELCMPPVRYSGALCEEFTAWVRQTPRTADPLWAVPSAVA
jgi:hypothetical protein